MLRSNIQHFPNPFGCEVAHSWRERSLMDGRKVQQFNKHQSLVITLSC